jgi:hypothetical protein
MTNQFGQAGKSTREGADKRRKTAIIIAIGAVLLAVIGCVVVNNPKAFGVGSGGVLLILAGMWLLLKFIDRPLTRLKKQERQYNRGARGEEQVGQLLSQLSSNFVVMHDVASLYGNIDHIVYDNRGNIFMVETKSHGGRVASQGDQLLLNGHAFEKDIVGQCLANSIWMKEKIESRLKMKAWITPVLVFSNAFVEFGKPIKGVYYTNKKYLLQFLQRTNASSPAGAKLWGMRKVKDLS